MKPARCAALLLALVACGCPHKEPGLDEAPPPATTAEGPADAQADAQAGPPAEVEASPEPPPSVPPPLAGPPPPPVPRPDDGRPQTDRPTDREIVVGGRRLAVWVVADAASRELGLMHVRELPRDHGMLFVYPDAARRRFWMKNTYVPLSLAYIAADGRIEQLVDMEPLTLDGHPSRSAVRFVLEVQQGWFRRNGVEVGDRVEGILDLVGHW